MSVTIMTVGSVQTMIGWARLPTRSVTISASGAIRPRTALPHATTTAAAVAVTPATSASTPLRTSRSSHELCAW